MIMANSLPSTPQSGESKHVYGWRRDSLDARDHLGLLYVAQPTNLPASVSLRSKMPGVYNQGSLGSCTANAIAAALQYQQHVQGETEARHRPSRLFIYWNERDLEGSTDYDSGAQLRDGIKVVASLGAPAESDWPYHPAQFAVKPPQQAYDDALKYKAVQYSRVPQTVNALKAALAAGHPVAFGFTVYESFESSEVAATGIVPMPDIHYEQRLGGHAVLIVGYKQINGQLYFEVRNSWGSHWGDHGYFWMPAAYLVDPAMASDFWDINVVS